MKLLLAVNSDNDSKGDAAFIMLKDGSTILGGAVGAPITLMDALGRLLIKEPHIREMVLMTVDAYREADAKVEALKNEDKDAAE